MKKNIVSLGFSVLICGVLLFSPTQYVSAQQPSVTTTIAAGLDNLNYKIPCPTVFCSLEDVVNAAANLIRPIFVLTFIAMLIYGAWLWLTSQGDDKKLGTAKKSNYCCNYRFCTGCFCTYNSTVYWRAFRGK